MSNPYYYKGVNPTVDLIVVAPNANQEVLMIVRSEKAQACPNMMAFPGGFIDTQSKKGEVWKDGYETAKKAAFRELKEETGLNLIDESRLDKVGEYEGSQRDPRDNIESWSKSHAFVYFLNEQEFKEMKGKEVGLDDAAQALWIPLATLMKSELAFDHNVILKDMIKLLKKKQYFMK